MNTLKAAMAAIAIVFSVSVFAGYTQPAPVVVTVNDDGSFSASGDMWTARSSKSDVTSIGCGTKKFAGGSSSGFCQATNEDDEYIACFTADPHILDAINALNDSSYIRFDGDANGECTRIDVSSQSFYLNLTTTKGKQ